MIELPKIMAQAMAVSTYSGQYEERYASVTELLEPTWVNRLKRIHKGEYTQDLRKMAFAFLGTAFHEAVESRVRDMSSVISEERLSMEIDGLTITGGVDLYYQDPDTKEHILTDLKTTTSYAMKKESRQWEWACQLNCYAELYRQAGYPVDRLSIVVLIRDMKTTDWEDPEQQQVQEIGFNMWHRDDIQQWIRARILKRESLNQAANEPESEEIALYNEHGCTQEDRWESPETYPVLKTGNTRASKTFDTMAKAMEWADQQTAAGKGEYVIGRNAANRRRCANYCDVSGHCAGYQAWLATGGPG